uniref:Uncharacterized protein n=1 Tax=Arundo donax TaxID=35708 RepID=A0A0A8Y0X0_ARUDO
MRTRAIVVEAWGVVRHHWNVSYSS